MIKLSTKNFLSNTHPPVVVHYEMNSSDNDKNYIDEHYLEGKIEEMISNLSKYITTFIKIDSLKKEKDNISGTCKLNPNINHIFIIKHTPEDIKHNLIKGLIK